MAAIRCAARAAHLAEIDRGRDRYGEEASSGVDADARRGEARADYPFSKAAPIAARPAGAPMLSAPAAICL